MLSLVAIFVLFPVYYMITLSLRSQSSLFSRSTLLPVDSNLDNYYRGTFAARLSIVGSIGGFIFGYDTGIIAGA